MRASPVDGRRKLARWIAPVMVAVCLSGEARAHDEASAPADTTSSPERRETTAGEASPSVTAEPPVPLEAFATPRGLLFQLTLSKHFSEDSRFGVFHLTEFFGDFRQPDHFTHLAQTFVTVDVWKGFAVNGGVTLNHLNGLRPSTGLQYLFANQTFLVLLLPRIDLSETFNFETFGLVQFNPRFTENWGLYSRAQVLYSQNLRDDLHEISYLRLRLGAWYKHYQFGVGGNFDFYGPDRTNENGLGVFVRADLF